MQKKIKRVSALKKTAIIAASLVVGIACGMSAYCFFKKDLSDWQKEQRISFEHNTGSTKFNAMVKATSVGMGAFGISACGIIVCLRIKYLKGKK